MPKRAAIIGCGTVTQAHLNALNAVEGLSVTDIYSEHLSADEAREVSLKHKVTVHHDLQAMLKDSSIDLVSICSRPDKHVDHAIQVAKAGKHLILEKPIALSWVDCQRVKEAVDESGVMVSVCFECRYSDQLLKSKAIVESQLGHVTYCETGYFHGIGPDNPQFSWNTKKTCGGSSLLSAGCHALDALLFLMGDPPVERVSSVTVKRSHPRYSLYEYPPHQFTTLTFKDGRVGYVASSIGCNQPYDFPIRVMGEQGSLVNDKLFIYEDAPPKQEDWKQVPMAQLKSGEVGDHPYEKQFADFVNNIRLGNLDCIKQQFEAALETHRVIFAADKSAELGQSVYMGDTVELAGQRARL